jgi:hypothetical protein
MKAKYYQVTSLTSALPRKRHSVLSLLAIITILIFAFTGFFSCKRQASHSSDELIILVADFEGPESQNYRVTKTIVEQMREAAKAYNDVQVKTLGRAITTQEGSDRARVIGKDQKAGIVLWGWYGKSEENIIVTVHFEVLPESRSLPVQKKKLNSEMILATHESFEVQVEFSGKMSYLVRLNLGLADNPEFSDLDALTKQIERSALNFIKDVESFLSKHKN